MFGMSVGTSVAVINYISQVFSPIENLGMETEELRIEDRMISVYKWKKAEYNKPEKHAAGICFQTGSENPEENRHAV